MVEIIGCYGVAKDEEAFRQYVEYWDDSNWECFDPTKEELLTLLSNGGVFEQINDECKLLIDLAEEEIIKGENILKALEIVNRTPGTESFVFGEALRKAAEYGTAVSIQL